MSDAINEFVAANASDWDDEIYGPGYRCAAKLKDGTELPCLIIRCQKPLTDLAIRRFKDERSGRSVFANSKDGYRKIVQNFVSVGNKLNDYDIQSVSKSRFAIPKDILDRIRGETFMSWTGWVFEMSDGRKFSYGSTFNFAFFQLPQGYEFSDIADVHNHSYVDNQGSIQDLRQLDEYSEYYASRELYRERVFFECYAQLER